MISHVYKTNHETCGSNISFRKLVRGYGSLPGDIYLDHLSRILFSLLGPPCSPRCYEFLTLIHYHRSRYFSCFRFPFLGDKDFVSFLYKKINGISRNLSNTLRRLVVGRSYRYYTHSASQVKLKSKKGYRRSTEVNFVVWCILVIIKRSRISGFS